MQLLNCGCGVLVGDEAVVATDARPNIVRVVELDQADLILHKCNIHAEYFDMVDLLKIKVL